MLELAAQRLPTHNAPHARVVELIVLVLRRGRRAPIAIPGELQHDALNGVAERDVARRVRRLVQPLVEPRAADAQQ
jgi:hypothetical protein